MAPEAVAPSLRDAERGRVRAEGTLSDVVAPMGYTTLGVGPSAALPAEAAVARDIARQVAAQPGLAAEGTAELHLSPEELGPLRLSVERGEDGLRLVIEAARPETADLLRRQIEALRQELRQEGLGAIGVSIGGGDARRGQEGARHPDRTGAEPGVPASGPAIPIPIVAAATAARSRGAGGHLDLRF